MARARVLLQGLTTDLCNARARPAAGRRLGNRARLVGGDTFTEPPPSHLAAHRSAGTCPAASRGGTCSALLTPSASGTDACEGPLTGTCAPDELTLNAPGTTSATCTVADCSGNSASCTQSLTLIDDTPPAIKCASPLVTPPA